MIITDIHKRLFSLRDEKYAQFSAKLIPGFSQEYFIGVRTPQLKSLAREIVREGNHDEFLESLPHRFFEENLLHAFIIATEKLPIEATVARVELFLPYIDNWAVCDQFSVKIFGRYPEILYPLIKKWMKSDHTYTRRFAIVNSMRFFLDEKFTPTMLKDVARATTDHYYIRMCVAWYFATALAKQWSDTIPYIEQRILPADVHKKTIRKAIESFRITVEQKAYLRQLS